MLYAWLVISWKVHKSELIWFLPKKSSIYLNLRWYKYCCRVLSSTRDRLMIHDDQWTKRCSLVRVIVGVQCSNRARTRALLLKRVHARKSQRDILITNQLNWATKKSKDPWNYTCNILRGFHLLYDASSYKKTYNKWRYFILFFCNGLIFLKEAIARLIPKPLWLFEVIALISSRVLFLLVIIVLLYNYLFYFILFILFIYFSKIKIYSLILWFFK